MHLLNCMKCTVICALQMWLDYKLLESVSGTEREDIDYEQLYEELSAKEKEEYEEKRQQFLSLSGLCD